ncbi:MAG: threonine--tRNA ligase [SAR202 cluster bacterium]|nr:threonine--tRNA ligase [SAR202 cluster bacterium]
MPVKEKSEAEARLEDRRRRLRHSAAHIMADAVTRLYPGTKFAIGPATEDGFYYDFMADKPFTPEDLAKIEEAMKREIEANHEFELVEVSRDEAKRRFADQPFKLEIIDAIPEGAPITVYRHGGFVDLCRGPHVESTGQVPALKLMSVAGAYWRGDERNPMLQRIYGTAWESREALDAYLRRLEEANRRDHRKLGRDLDLFSISDQVGPGLIIWHPKGARIRSIMEEHWRSEHLRRGYELVYSPHIGRGALWETSGHLGFYRENMYDAMEVDDQEYFAKPMNCPFHIQVYKSAKRSYRELPMRLTEMGTVYRYERSGVLHGLMRVRGFTQDDAHIFCRPEQVEDEVIGVLDFAFSLLGAFGFTDYDVYLSTKPEKAVGRDEDWRHATDSLRRALERKNIAYSVDEGGGAFYGPKLDIKVKDAIGRAWQCTTVQFDFNLPARFGLTYAGQDGVEHQPFMVHRALFGSLERFFGVLIEHYGGAFPLWLAPVQATVIPIADRHVAYAQELRSTLTAAGFRVQVDDRNERMNAKIRDAQLQKVPYMLVVGDKEAEANGAAVRLRSGEDLKIVPTGDIIARMQDAVADRR